MEEALPSATAQHTLLLAPEEVQVSKKNEGVDGEMCSVTAGQATSSRERHLRKNCYRQTQTEKCKEVDEKTTRGEAVATETSDKRKAFCKDQFSPLLRFLATEDYNKHITLTFNVSFHKIKWWL